MLYSFLPLQKSLNLNFIALKKLLFFFLLAAITGLPAQAQWVNQPLSLPANKTIFNINVVNANVIWAEVFYDQLIRTTNGGATWSVININHPDFTSNYYIQSVYALDANTAWITATDFQSLPNNGFVSKVFKTTDGGITWVHQASAYPNPNALVNSWSNFIYFFDANNGITGGDGAYGHDRYFEIYTTTDGGSSWHRVPPGDLPVPTVYDASDLTGIHCKVGNTVWFGANQMRVFKSTNRGATWTYSNTGFAIPPVGFTEVEQLAFADQNNGLISVGTNLRKTTDGGLTWSPVNYTGPFYTSHLAGVPGTTNTFVSVSYSATNPGSSYTTDGGNTWTAIENSIRHQKVAFLNKTTGWSSGVNAMNKYTGNPVGIAKAISAASGFHVYPNPSASGTFFIEPKGRQPFKLEVYDLTGNRISVQQENRLGKTVLDLSEKSKGIYLLHILNGEQRLVEKIVLQ